MKKNVSFIINIIIFLLLIIGLVLETFELVMRGEGLYLLVRRFKFFTELSNIFAGITSFVYAYYLFNNKKKNPIPNVLKILKLISTGSVIVTFLTVIFYLIPVSGSNWKFLVVGSQFIFHIIIPILCFITYTFYEDNKVHSVCIDIDKNEQIGVCFEKGYVVVRTQTEVKFVCKGKAFISLWR